MDTTHPKALPLELGATVRYNGETGEVIGFGSADAAFATLRPEATPSANAVVVKVAHGRYRITRHLPLDCLEVVAS